MDATGARLRCVFVHRYFHPDESVTSQLLTDLCVHLAGSGAEVHVVTSRQMIDRPDAALPRREVWNGIHIHRLNTTRFGRMDLRGRAIDYLSFYAAAAWRLAFVVRRGDIVIAKTDPPLVSIVARWVCRVRGARLVNWLQDLFPEVAERLGVRIAGGRLGRWMKAARDRSLHAAAANVVLGERMAAQVRSLVPGARVTVIHNWSDGARIVPTAPPDNPLRRAWGLDARFVVAYSGNMGRAHEFDTILEACGALASDDVTFLFIGSGKQRAALEAAVAREGWRHVRFQPYQPREALAFSLSVADVHLVTLKPALEGLMVPSKFYGIAAAGRPTVFVGDTRGEIAAIVTEAGCGVAVASGDAAALVHAIRRLRHDPAAAALMGARARAVFEARFDRPDALRRWADLLRSCA